MKSKENRIFTIPAKRFAYAVLWLKMLIMPTTRMGFEPGHLVTCAKYGIFHDLYLVDQD